MPAPPTLSPRSLAPLWARVALAAGLGTAAPAIPHQVRTPALLVAAGAIAALEWPDLRLRRAAALGGAALAGFLLGGVENGRVLELRWIGAAAGAASALLLRPGEARRRDPARLAALAMGGALVGRLAGLPLVWAEREGLQWSPRIPGDLDLTLWPAAIAATLALAIAAAGRLTRGAGPLRALAVLWLSIVAIGVERGDFRTSAEVRLDTGDLRFTYLGWPFFALRTEETPEPARSRLLEIARTSAILRPEWRRCATLGGWEGEERLRSVREGYLEARDDFDQPQGPRIARCAAEDVAEWVVYTRGEHGGPPWTGHGSGLRPGDILVRYCRERGFDPSRPGWAPGIAATEEGLREQARRGETAWERGEAARALAARFPATAREAVEVCLFDPEPRVRAAAARALADLGDRASLAALRDARDQDGRAAAGDPRHWREATAIPAYDEAIARLEAGAP